MRGIGGGGSKGARATIYSPPGILRFREKNRSRNRKSPHLGFKN